LNTIIKSKKNNKLGLDLISNYVSVIILGGSGLTINLLIAKYYDPEILGIFNQVVATYIVFSMLGSGGINYSMLRAVAANSANQRKLTAIIKGGIFLTLIISLLTTLIYAFLIPTISQIFKSDSVGIGMKMICPGIFFFSLNKVMLHGVINGLQLMKRYAFYQSLRYIIILISVGTCVLFSIDGKTLPVAFSISESILFVILISQVSIRIKWLQNKKWLSWAKIHFIYSYKAFISGFLLESNTRIDILILGIFLNDKEVGIYSFAAFFAEGFTQLLYVIQNTYNPVLASMISSNKLDQVLFIIKKLKKRIYISALIFSTFVSLIFPKIIDLVTINREFQGSYIPFIILILGITIASGYIPFNNILLMANLPGIQTKFIFMAVSSNIVMNFLLIPMLGLIGASISTSIAFLCSVFLLRKFSYRYIGLKF
tara:strand:+ start:12284 stop:13567 length:1284 start_codon:yes stop_codon:yes gene_type:complete